MNAEEYSERGGKYFDERNFDKAIADFSEVIKLDSKNSFAYYKRGLSYTNKKEFDLAIVDFTEAIQLEPDKFGDFYFDRALTYIHKGNKDMAISDLEMAVKIDPQNESYREVLKDVKTVRNDNSSSKRKRGVGTTICFIFIIIFIISGIIGKNIGVAVIGVILVVLIWGIVEWIRKKAKQAKELFTPRNSSSSYSSASDGANDLFIELNKGGVLSINDDYICDSNGYKLGSIVGSKVLSRGRHIGNVSGNAICDLKGNLICHIVDGVAPKLNLPKFG